MSANNLSSGTRLETATVRGDQARGVVYIDRRLAILKNMTDTDSASRHAVQSVIGSYPSYEDAVETMQLIANRHNELHTGSAVFAEMMSGKLIRNWRNTLVALHVRLQGPQNC